MFKGFVEINEIVNGSNDLINITELSYPAFTSKPFMNKYTTKDITLYGFSFEDNKIPIPLLLADNIEEVVLQLKEYAAGLSPVNFDGNRLKSQLLNRFLNVVSDIQLGTIINENQLTLPSSISWLFNQNGVRTSVKIWLSSSKFLQEYDEYSVIVIPPITPINDLFNEPNEVIGLINNKSYKLINDKVNDVIRKQPITALKTFITPYKRSGKTVDIEWSLLINGAAGDNIDAFKDSVINYLKSNSEVPESSWKSILPSLFERTEFFIYLINKDVALDDATEQSTIYSSTIAFTDILTLAKLKMSNFVATDITTRTELMQHTYKFCSLIVVSGENNPTDYKTIKQVVPDYVPAVAGTLAYERMTTFTQRWSYFINQLLAASDNVVIDNSEFNFRTTVKGGVSYLTGTFYNINYHVVIDN